MWVLVVSAAAGVIGLWAAVAGAGRGWCRHLGIAGAGVCALGSLVAPVFATPPWRTVAEIAAAEAMTLLVGPLVALVRERGPGSRRRRGGRRATVGLRARRYRLYWRLRRPPVAAAGATVAYAGAVLSWYGLAPVVGRVSGAAYGVASLAVGSAFWSQVFQAGPQPVRSPRRSTALAVVAAIITTLANAAGLLGVVTVPASGATTASIVLFGPHMAVLSLLDLGSALTAVAVIITVLSWLYSEDGSVQRSGDGGRARQTRRSSDRELHFDRRAAM